MLWPFVTMVVVKMVTDDIEEMLDLMIFVDGYESKGMSIDDFLPNCYC